MCSVRDACVNRVEESKRLNDLRFPAVIVSASGMATGGRVLHHLKAYAPDPRNTIVFAGFQAAGHARRGARRRRAGGQDPRRSTCRCAPRSCSSRRCRPMPTATSCSAGSARCRRRRARMFVTHGEPVAADALRQAIEERHGWNVMVPEERQVVI